MFVPHPNPCPACFDIHRRNKKKRGAEQRSVTVDDMAYNYGDFVQFSYAG